MGAKICTPKMAQPDCPNGKFCVFPRWSLWSGGGGGGPGGGGVLPLLFLDQLSSSGLLEEHRGCAAYGSHRPHPHTMGDAPPHATVMPRFLGLFLEQKVLLHGPHMSLPQCFFCSCGITTTNLHCLISLFGLETLLSSKSRCSVRLQCLHGKNTCSEKGGLHPKPPFALPPPQRAFSHNPGTVSSF